VTRRSTPLVLAIDVGSSSVRAALFDADGRQRRGSVARGAYRPDADDVGSVTVPLERLTDVLGSVLDDLVARAGRDLPRVEAAGLSVFLHSFTGVDARGRPVAPLRTWADTTAASEADRLRGELDEAATWQATGAPLHPSVWPAKILAFRDTLEGARAASYRGAPELLWRWLTGEDGVDVSQASGTGLLDRASGDWHAGLLRALALEPGESLPPIVPAGTSGALARRMATRWPALRRVRWLAPWSDASCGNVGLGLEPEAGDAPARPRAALQVGTSGAIRSLVPDTAPRLTRGLFAHRVSDDLGLIGGQLSEGGGTLEAIARLLGRAHGRLDREAAGLAPGAHGLTVLPFLAGERGPGYHARARGAIDGIRLGTSAPEVYLATAEAIALRFADLDRRLAAALGAAPEVVASGGAVDASALLAELLASALGRPVRLSSEGEASLRGAAIRALVAGGIADATSLAEPPSRVVEPDAARATALGEAAGRQATMYEALLG
jgi:gluconokinase